MKLCLLSRAISVTVLESDVAPITATVRLTLRGNSSVLKRYERLDKIEQDEETPNLWFYEEVLSSQ